MGSITGSCRKQISWNSGMEPREGQHSKDKHPRPTLGPIDSLPKPLEPLSSVASDAVRTCLKPEQEHLKP